MIPGIIAAFKRYAKRLRPDEPPAASGAGKRLTRPKISDRWRGLGCNLKVEVIES